MEPARHRQVSRAEPKRALARRVKKRDRKMPATWKIGVHLLNSPPFFLGNILFHLLLINTVYTLALSRSQGAMTRGLDVARCRQQRQGWQAPNTHRCWWLGVHPSHRGPGACAPIGPIMGSEPAEGYITNTCLGKCTQVWKPMDPMDLVSSHSFL